MEGQRDGQEGRTGLRHRLNIKGKRKGKNWKEKMDRDEEKYF